MARIVDQILSIQDQGISESGFEQIKDYISIKFYYKNIHILYKAFEDFKDGQAHQDFGGGR